MISRVILVLIACVLFISCTATYAEQPALVSVRDYGAKGDGIGDDTFAFQSALDAVKEKGGTVSVPAGTYAIKTHIVVPDNVTLEGVWNYPAIDIENSKKGSTLLAFEGAGSEEGPAFVTLKTNATIKGIAVYYPEQKPENLKPYPWCIAGDGVNVAIIDCMLVNPYQGVDLGTRSCDRHLVRNLYGHPLRRGLFVDKCFDIGRIENVHFWPFWNTWRWTPEQMGALGAVTSGQGEAFIFARTDWEYVTNTFCWGYKIGYKFMASKDGAMNGNLLGIGADATEIAVLVETCNQIGLLITNGEFVSFTGEKPTTVVVKESNGGTVQFQNSSFWGTPYQIARIAGSGSVSFNNCNFLPCRNANGKVPSIETFGGNLLVNGCNFQDDLSPQITLRGDTQTAVVVGNRMAGPIRVSNPAKADVQIGLNVVAKPPKRPQEERGAIVVDDEDGYPSVALSGNWQLARGKDLYYRGTRWAVKGNGDSKAIFKPSVPKTGRYTVFVYFGPDPVKDHASNAPVEIRFADGVEVKHANLRPFKGAWLKLGTYKFLKGQSGSITFSNAANGNVMADAVKLLPVK